MTNKRLLKKYLWLLFCSIVMVVVSVYAYIHNCSAIIILIGFACSLSAVIELLSLIIALYKDKDSNISK